MPSWQSAGLVTSFQRLAAWSPYLNLVLTLSLEEVEPRIETISPRGRLNEKRETQMGGREPLTPSWGNECGISEPCFVGTGRVQSSELIRLGQRLT